MSDTSAVSAVSAVSAKALRFYNRLRPLAVGGRIVARGQDLCAPTQTAYPLVVKYLNELEDAGWLTRRRQKYGPTEIHMRAPELVAPAQGDAEQQEPVAPAAANGWVEPTGPNEPTELSEPSQESSESSNRESSQSSQSSFEKVHKVHEVHASASEVRTSTENQMQACMHAANVNSVNFEPLAEFRQRLMNLLAEFNINGVRRTRVCDAICALVISHFGVDRAEECLVEVRRGLEHAKARETAGLAKSAALVGAAILEDYAETGQMHLFPIPSSAAQAGKPTAAQRGKSSRTRLGQVEYTDERRAAAEEEARQKLAARNAAREAQKVATS